MLIGKTLGFVEVFKGFAFLAIIFRNLDIKFGLGYNSMSDGSTKCVKAASLAMFLATFTGYRRFFCFMYVVVGSTTYGGRFEQLYEVVRRVSISGIWKNKKKTYSCHDHKSL